MALIFVSYRREDSTAVTGRICDRLRRSYGEKSVFLDFSSIPIADDFDETIRAALARSSAMLAIVGPRWTGPVANGEHRIQRTDDFVRREIEQALSVGIPVVPVLVGGAEMLSSKDVPPTLAPFCMGQAARVDDTVDFHQHMRRLVSRIDQIVRAKLWLWLRVLIRAALVGLGGLMIGLGIAPSPLSVPVRAASVGSALATWLALWIFATRYRLIPLDLSPGRAALIGVALGVLLSGGPSAVARLAPSGPAEKEILADASELRTEFANARTAFVKSGNADFAGAQAIAVSLLHTDGENGHGWYYQGEIARIQAPNYFSPGSCALEQPVGKTFSLALYETDFGRYLDIEHDLPKSETGGALGSEVCYQRAKGYCLQRTLWIKHLLAVDLYREAMAQPDPVDRTSKLRRALKLAQATLDFHRPDDSGDGFTQCIETGHLIETTQQALAAAETAEHDLGRPTH